MRLFGKTTIDFMGKRKLWYTISGSLILIGLISLLIKGVDYGIDFLGGTELVVGFARPVQVGDVRSSMDRTGFGKAEIKTFGTDRDILIRTSEQGEGVTVGDRIRAGLAASFPDNAFTVLKEDKIGPKIGAELRRDAVYAVVASLIAILLYERFPELPEGDLSRLRAGLVNQASLFEHAHRLKVGTESPLRSFLGPGTIETEARFLTTVCTLRHFRNPFRYYLSLHSLPELPVQSLPRTMVQSIA